MCIVHTVTMRPHIKTRILLIFSVWLNGLKALRIIHVAATYITDGSLLYATIDPQKWATHLISSIRVFRIYLLLG